jgi:uncharacterized protein (TIRG00374 family)
MTQKKDENEKRKGRFRLLQYGLHAAVLLGLIYAGMKYVNGDAFAHAIRRFDWRYAPVICLLSVGYVLIKGWRFTGMMRDLTETAPRGLLMRAYVSGQAATLLPGGAAARAGLLKQAGIPAAETAAPLALSSLSDQAMFLLLSIAGAMWFEQARRPVLALLAVLLTVSLLLGIEATRTWLLRLIDRLMGRFKLREHWGEFREAMAQVATPPRLLSALVNTACAFVCLLVALHLALRGVGATGVPPMTILLAFALPTMLGRVSALPGGFGVTEAGMVGILDHAPGVTLDQAAVAVTVYRLGTVVFAALVGGLVYLFAWRGEKAAQKMAEAEAAAATPDTASDGRKMEVA